MNPKFFDVKKEKQDAIINAALMVFAENGYRKASTDVMVKEAGISKGLLFHYFISKQGVYEFVYDYSVKYMMLELMQTVRRDEKDFFSIQRMIELAKTRVMKNYPYMQQFLSSVKYENHPDALKVIKESDKVIDDTYNSIYKRADMSRFSGPVDQQKIIKMIGWMSDGYIKDKFREGTPDLDEMNAEFAQYLSMLRDHFYGSAAMQKAQPMMAALEEEVERDDSVMDSIRDEMLNTAVKEQPEQAEAKPKELSFEERLALGKKSAYAADTSEGIEEVGKDDEEAAGYGDEETALEAESSEEEVKEASLEDEGIQAEEAEESIKAEEAEVQQETQEGTEDTADEEAEEPEEEVTEESEEAVTEEPLEELKDEGADNEALEDTDKEALDASMKEDSAEISEPEEEPHNEVTISIESFSGGYRGYDNYGSMFGDTTYAASPTVTSYVPAADLSFYEESRLGDFTYGSDARGGRGIPYDSSENIQIFVSEDDDADEAGETSDQDESFDISGLSEKIMSNTDRETAEAERTRELESMGPAPVLPDFSPENIRNKTSSDDDDEDSHIYRPLKF